MAKSAEPGWAGILRQVHPAGGRPCRSSPTRSSPCPRRRRASPDDWRCQSSFRKGNPLLSLRDELGTIFADADFADLFPTLGQPGLPPWRLALITILQFREDLPDRRAAEAVRARIDWKYLLGLELTDPGFDHSVLCAFC